MKIHKRHVDVNAVKSVSPRLPVVSRSVGDQVVQPHEPTVSEARKELFNHLHLGMTCPVCDRFTKKYQRTITKTMGEALYILYKVTNNGDGYVHLAQLFANQPDPTKFRGDFAKLRYWNLIEEYPEAKGYWKITDDGIKFVTGMIDVPKYVYVYNHAVDACSNERITITDCLNGDALSKTQCQKPPQQLNFLDIFEMLFGKDVAPDGTTGI